MKRRSCAQGRSPEPNQLLISDDISFLSLGAKAETLLSAVLETKKKDVAVEVHVSYSVDSWW
jgi:hypothetical protein